jgi:hypothetical protein
MTTSVSLSWEGRTLSVTAWAADPAVAALGITVPVIYSRLRLGWPTSRILTQPTAPRRENGYRRARQTSSIVDPHLPWELDEAARDFVAKHPDGGTLHEVGEALGVTRERVRQIEEKALRKLARSIEQQHGEARALLFAWFQQIAASLPPGVDL